MIIKSNLKIKSILLIKNPDLNILIPMTEEIKKIEQSFIPKRT